MEIKIKNLTLTHFKGITNLSIDFTDVLYISGDNGTGKTTIFDAFIWLLFGKDSSDKKDFNIKTLDGFGNAIPQIDHQVSAILSLSGTDITLRRLYREKWQKKRGELATELTGHETLYYYNHVPLQQKEYQAKIAEIVSEQLFKMLTSCYYFNNLSWSEQRTILTTLVPSVSDQEVASSGNEFSTILNHLSGKSLIEFKRELKARRDKLKFDLADIPSRISENHRLLPPPADYDSIRRQIHDTKLSLTETEASIAKESEIYTRQYSQTLSQQKQIHALQIELSSLKDQIQRDHIHEVSQLKTKEYEIKNSIHFYLDQTEIFSSRIRNYTDEISQLNQRNALLRSDYQTLINQSFSLNEQSFTCPACLRALDPETIASHKSQLLSNFNTSRENQLLTIEQEGIANNQRIEKLTILQSSAKNDFETNEINLAAASVELGLLIPDSVLSLDSRYSSSLACHNLNKKISDLTRTLIVAPPHDLGTLKIEKSELQNKLDALQKSLFQQAYSEKLLNRIQDLKKEESTLSQQLADLEKLEFQIAAFSKAKMELIESKINSLFSYVSFRMFDHQINGSETETCVALINGIPYPDANSAAKINAGLDIINVLSEFNQVFAPIFIDNRESVNQLIPCKSQIINLLVSKDKTLHIS